jgi:polyisoprenoid-binding protein YceI
MFFKMRSAYFVAAMSAVLTVAAVASAKYHAHNKAIVVHATGPAGMKIDGTSSSLVIDETDTTVTFKSMLNEFKTGIPMRDGHIAKNFETAKYPDLKLTIEKAKVEGKNAGTVKGDLAYHGKSKPVDVTYKVTGKKVHAEFKFDVKDHGINDKHVCYLGVCAQTGVAVVVDFDWKD